RGPSLKIVLREADDARDLAQEPAIDPRALVDELDLRSAAQRREEAPQPVVRRLGREELIDESRWVGHFHPRRRLPEQPLTLDLEGTQSLQQGCFERSVDGHDLT